MMVGGAVLIGLLVLGLLFPPSAAARQRTKIAAVGGVLAFLSPVAGYFVSYVMGVSIPFNLIAIPLAVFPVAIGWAIVKDDLFEVDAIIRRAVAWAILTGLIAALYLAGVGLLELWFAGRASRVAQLFFLLGAGGGAQPAAQPGAGGDRLPVRARQVRLPQDRRRGEPGAGDAARPGNRGRPHPDHDHRDHPRRVRRRVAARRGRHLPPAGGGRPRRRGAADTSSRRTAR